MHRFSTSSGKMLWYDVTNNRISLWNPSKDTKAFPVIQFKEPTKVVSADKIRMFTIEMTQQCNLRCSYCCYSGLYRDRRPHNNKEISITTLRQTVDFIKRHADKESTEITVCFYGGEALLAQEKMKWLTSELTSVFGEKIIFSLSTNGLALTESIVDWICSYDRFLVNVTIDGNKAMHDKYRKTKTGQGSFEVIVKNLELFQQKYPVSFNDRVRFLSTVYSWRDVEKLAEVWDMTPILAGHYPIHISHIIPNFSTGQQVYDTWEVKNDFYKKAYAEYIIGKKNILSGCFQKLLDIVNKRNYLTLADELKIETCFQSLFSCFINVNGDVYACERFCGEAKIGNVFDGFDDMSAQILLRHFTERKNIFCSSCWAQRFCRMCMTGLNYTDEEMNFMCEMERDTIDLALKYYCDLKDWEQINNKKIGIFNQ